MPDGAPLAATLPAARPLRDDAADTVRGILLVVICYALMVAGDVASKWALPAAGIGMVMLGRGLFGALTVTAFSLRGEGPRAGLSGLRRLVPVRWKLVLLRSALHSMVSVAWYVAWLFVPLADAYAVGFTSPLLMTLLAVPLLGERIRWRRMLSLLVGFGGVLIMVRPGTALWTPVLAVLLPSVAVMALTRLMTRLLSTTETPDCLTFWLMVAHLPAGLLCLVWFPPNAPLGWAVLVALLLLGGLNASAHRLMARGYALAPVSAVAPYEYTTLIWGVALGWLFFDEVPAWTSLAGGGVVAAAGLYNLHRERVRRQEEARCRS